MPKNSIHGEAVKALVSDQELREAMVDVGVSVRVLDDPTSQECTALMLGIRLTLVPDFKSQFDTLGVQISDMEYADSVTDGIAAAKLIINRRDPSKPAAKASGVSGLSSLGDLREPPQRRFFVVEEVEEERVRTPFCRPCGDYHNEEDCEYDEDEFDEDDDYDYVEAPRTIPLTVSVATLSAAKALEVAAALIPVLADKIGAYAVGGSRADDYGATVDLNPIGDTSGWVRNLPSGTVVFDNPVTTEGGDVFGTKVLVAGEIDPSRPPYEIADFIQRRIGDTPEIERLVLELTRLDGATFTEAQLTDPLNKAVLVISDKFGPITVLETEEGDTPNVRRASLRLDGTGELDPRVLTQGIAGFDGTVPFPGLGQVRSRLIGGE